MGRYLLLLSLLSLLVGAGCCMRQADLTVISSRIVNLDEVDLDRIEGQRVTGEDKTVILLGIPIGFPHLEDAIDDALNKGNGDLITDVVIHSCFWSLVFVGESWMTVEGTVVKTRGAEADGGTTQ